MQVLKIVHFESFRKCFTHCKPAGQNFSRSADQPQKTWGLRRTGYAVCHTDVNGRRGRSCKTMLSRGLAVRVKPSQLICIDAADTVVLGLSLGMTGKMNALILKSPPQLEWFVLCRIKEAVEVLVFWSRDVSACTTAGTVSKYLRQRVTTLGKCPSAFCCWREMCWATFFTSRNGKLERNHLVLSFPYPKAFIREYQPVTYLMIDCLMHTHACVIVLCERTNNNTIYMHVVRKHHKYDRLCSRVQI